MKKWLLIGGLGWLLGWGGSAVLEQTLETPSRTHPTLAATTQTQTQTQTLARGNYTAAIVGRDIFSLRGEVSLRKTTAAGPAPKAVLLATVVASEPQDSSALIFFGEYTGGYGIGDSLSDSVTVVDIQPRSVVVKVEDSLHTLTFQAPSAGDSRPLVSTPTTVSRDEITALIGEGGGGIRAVPHKDASGEVDGYRISGIRRKSLLYRLGAKNGDILHGVNGIAFDSTKAVMEAYNTLADADQFTAYITRRGKPVSLSADVE
ncbi:MAG: type II secretory pathway component PulC [Myxococcota bacterium]|jgi:type II secretory pathway component PulC